MGLVLENGNLFGLSVEDVVLFGLHQLELLLGNPIVLGSILVELGSFLLLVEVVDVDSLSGIVLLESEDLGLWLLGFFLDIGLSLLSDLAQDLVLVEFVLHVADSASSASTFSWFGAE